MKKLLITNLLVLSSLMMRAPNIENEVNDNVDRLVLSDELSEELNMYNIKRHMENIGIVHANIAIKQVALETSWLKSRICNKYNNLFGMHYPAKRPTTASGYIIADNGAKVATYDSWKDSIEDYLLYQKYWQSKGKDLSDYWKFLAQLGYSETSGYVKVLKGIKI